MKSGRETDLEERNVIFNDLNVVKKLMSGKPGELNFVQVILKFKFSTSS